MMKSSLNHPAGPAAQLGALPHILVVDDDARLRTLLHNFLTEHGFLVVTAPDAAAARVLLPTLIFDLIILDVMMPGEDGISLATDLRRRHKIPILMLTARGELEDRVKGFEAGVDDYLPKPFEPKELVLRCQAILRRALPMAANSTTAVRIGDWELSSTQNVLTASDQTVRLTDVEAKLLRVMAQHPSEILSRDRLSQLMGLESAQGRSVDVTVVRLRRKLGDDPAQPRYLQTVRGQGYILRLS